MKDLNILIPSAGHPTRPSLLKCFRDNKERQVRIIGMDMASDGIGAHIADEFYQVPSRKDPAYIEKVLGICKKERIDFYYAIGE